MSIYNVNSTTTSSSVDPLVIMGKAVAEELLLGNDLPEIKYKKMITQDNKDLQEIEDLYLDEKNLSNVPSQIQYFSNLTGLNLSDNKITNLPSGLEKLKLLEEFILEKNKLTSFPSVILRICSLTHLNISSNPIQNLSSELYKLGELKELKAENCGLTSLPSFKRTLNHLTDVYLSKNNLGQLPQGFVALIPNLRRIDLVSCHLQEFPLVLLQMSQTQYIDVSENNIPLIPNEIARLQKLFHLNIADNQITEIPDAVGELKLQCLIATSNPIQRITEKLRKSTPSTSEEILIQQFSQMILSQPFQESPEYWFDHNVQNILMSDNLREILSFAKAKDLPEDMEA